MSQRPVISAYLAKPVGATRQLPQVKDIIRQFNQITAANPRLLQRTIAALIIWSSVVGTIQNIAFTKPSTQHISLGGFSTLAASTNVPAAIAGQPIAAATAVAALPGGPSGQLLPPGTMAPDRTYRNTYALGQCTWYVAGRRQIPSNWGNANSWYYHAVASGWSVGATPAIAAVAWTSAGPYGHVALVEAVSANGSSVLISEMNYRGVGVKSSRWARTTDFKYIY
jgi:surface antigen